MATKKVIAKTELEAFEGVKSFKSNGNSKHLPKDAVYELNYELAKLLFDKGYLELC
jgi:hypothetical protein